MSAPITTPRFIYAVRSEELRRVKLGSAAKPLERRGTLQVGSADTLTLLCTAPLGFLEKRLQTALRGYYCFDAKGNARKEWFTTDILLEIERLEDPTELNFYNWILDKIVLDFNRSRRHTFERRWTHKRVLKELNRDFRRDIFASLEMRA